MGRIGTILSSILPRGLQGRSGPGMVTDNSLVGFSSTIPLSWILLSLSMFYLEKSGVILGKRRNSPHRNLFPDRLEYSLLKS